MKRFLSSTPLKRNIIQELYLTELRAYKPAKVVAKVDLPETFQVPKAPEIPQLVKSVAVESKEKMEAQEWSAFVDPIDDPENYNDEWNITQEKDDGAWFPKRVKEHDYHD
jgi:hypothetical protein